ncbi:MAG: hypothetical protein PUP92_36865, partial [Rhizonema sp. PD38]|nr:hypothetical protein [Rhizonema sp. PD38]
MSKSIEPRIKDKIKYWKKLLTDDTNSNPLLNFKKSEKLRVDIDTTCLLLFKNLVGDSSRALPVKELRTKQTNDELTKRLNKLRLEVKSTLE